VVDAICRRCCCSRCQRERHDNGDEQSGHGRRSQEPYPGVRRLGHLSLCPHSRPHDGQRSGYTVSGCGTSACLRVVEAGPPSEVSTPRLGRPDRRFTRRRFLRISQLIGSVTG
jgi:hypothetical protein